MKNPKKEKEKINLKIKKQITSQRIKEKKINLMRNL